MTTLGQTNYEAYREHAGRRSLVSGDPIPEWNDLPGNVRNAWDAGAGAVEQRLAEMPVDEDAPASEPAKVIVVTELFTGRASVQRYDANGWTITDGTLFVNRDGHAVGAYQQHAWLSFREEGPAGAGEASDHDGGQQ